MTKDAFAARRICDEISNSGVFASYGLKPVDFQEAAAEIEESRFKDIPIVKLDPNEYTNPYTRRPLPLLEFFPDDPKAEPRPVNFQDYVFVGLLRNEESNEIVPFYVSKPYVLPGRPGAHRFVFFKETVDSSPKLMLAEGSAAVFKRPRFNVELHYIEQKEKNESGTYE